MSDCPEWTQARSVLCVRLDGLGDVLMTVPAIRAVKHAVAGRRVTLLTSPAGAEAAALVPEIDETLVYDPPWMKATAARQNSKPDAVMIERLRHRFDGAIIFTVFSQSPLPAALLCFFADIPRRLAFCRENPYQLLTDWSADPEPVSGIRHEVRRQLDLVAQIGCVHDDERIRVRVPIEAGQDIDALLARLRLQPASPFVVMHPGASAPSRRYAPDGFAEATRAIAQRFRWPIVFTGAAGERSLIEEIRQKSAIATHSLAGQLSLPWLAALIARAAVVVTNNTGPAHLAAATGTPVVDLYALTNPQHTPWQVPCRVLFHDVPCKYCYKSICPEGHHDCLRLVAPSAIVNAVAELVNR